MIRHLKTAYGDFLDLERGVVGDIFDDRGTDGNIRNSILEVHRYPPRPEQLETLQRFSSLAPTSSARPHKRPLELPSQSYPSQASQNTHRAIPSIEGSDSEINRPYRAGTKRQRTHESGLNRKFGEYQRSMTREGQGAGPYQSSQTSRMQESIHQVVDSQKSPERKRRLYLSRFFVIVLIYLADPNPYGTPTSLPFISSQDSILRTNIDRSAIPDSPLGRDTTTGGGVFGGVVQLDRESTKSESPELHTSIQKLPFTDPNAAFGEQPISAANKPELSTTSCNSRSALQPVSTAHIVDNYAKDHGLGVRQTHEKAADIDCTPMRRPLTADLARTRNAQSYKDTLRESDPVFDPIESDTESFHEKQRMQSAKRLRSSKTPTTSFKPFRTSSGVEVDRRDGLFLVPSVPPSRTNGGPNSTRENGSSGQSENIQTPRQDPTASKVIVQSDPKRHREHDAEHIEDLQSKHSLHHDLMDAVQNLPQAGAAWSHDSHELENGTAQSNLQQKDDDVTSQIQEHDKSTHSSHNDNSVISNLEGGPSAQQADRLAKKAHEHQRDSAREPIEETTATGKEASDCNTQGKSLAKKKAAKGHQTKGQELAQARKQTVKQGVLTEARWNEETSVKEAQVPENKTTQELARERQTKEVLLAEEAKKLMLTADGAKKIEAEKIEKSKARLEELAGRQKANEPKADEQAKEVRARNRVKKDREEQRARESVQKLADIESKDAGHQEPKVYKAQTIRETATAVIVKAQRASADENLRKVRLSLNAQSRSMTPHIPSSRVNKSTSHSISLASSPLSNRSSGNMDAPLRSVLRQTPSTSRQSISSVTFDLPPQDELNNCISSTPKPQSLAGIKKESDKSSSTTKLRGNRSRTVPNTHARTPLKTPISKKAASSKITKIPANKATVQTKLNVTRERKKLKGRAVKPPITPRQAPKREISLSSGSESSTPENPVWQTGNAEAGPSSRKPIFRAATSAEAKPSTAPIDPEIGSIKVENRRMAARATLPHSTSSLETASVQMSKSRSPALALSETISVSSGSVSSSSNSVVESDSEGEPGGLSAKMSTGAKEGKLAPTTMNGTGKPANMIVDQSKNSSKSRAASQLSSQASSSRSRSTVPMHGDGEQVDQAADKQLQLESRSGRDKKVINQGLDHAGRLPNGIRPAYYKYPPLSELQKLPRAATPEVKPKITTSSSQPLDVSHVGKSGSDESSSESDESRSDSDEDEGVDAPSNQTWSEQKSRPYRGLKEVIKRRLCSLW